MAKKILTVIKLQIPGGQANPAPPVGPALGQHGVNIMWKSYNPNTEAVLVRNPYFKVWNPAAQPEGYPDQIVEKYGLQISDEVTQVERGAADEVFDGDVIPADRLNELNSPQYASQVHVNPLTADWYFAFNTTTPPFNNQKARQAVNYAADRSAYVKIGGGSALAVPTCQILPPNFPGYKPYCPYTAGSSTTKWTGPNMAKAQQLVNASGTKGATVKVNTTTNTVDRDLGLYFVGLLNKLGYHASLQALSPDIQYPYAQNSSNKPQFAFSSWYQDYPAASDFLNILLGCGSFHPNSNSSPNIAEFCNQKIQAKMDQAGQMGITDPAGANNLWATVDKETVDQAPWVAMFNPKYIDVLSNRVSGYQFSPQWYFLLAQASVK